MRLLRLEDDGGFSLAEYIGRNIPPYAILSHTWGADHDEVTLEDLVAGTGKNKAGYQKLVFCGKQAAKDNLQWFWVDTCSIDKSSSAELSEAINSMFRWYHKATRCYVYLSDVSTSGFATNDLSFQKSRWFTRGWTLQELIAPTSVEFFSAEGERLGDKISLAREIAEITGISIQALQGRPLGQFSVDERMSWAERRETKREEDIAYSLLGIFDIHMPLIYGEGRDRALFRLQKEIKESVEYKPLPQYHISATEAADVAEESYKYRISFNDSIVLPQEHQAADVQQRILDSLRFPQLQERRQQIHEAHKETYYWILQPDPDRNSQWDSFTTWLSSSAESRRVYWIHGKPGSGKSTMMRFLDQNIAIPHHLLPWAENRMVLSAQYYFWNPGYHKLQKSVAGLLRALLVQLLEQQPHLVAHVVRQRKWTVAQTSENHAIDWTNSDLQQALQEFILSVRRYARVFLLLDGLDELDGSDDARDELISLIISMASLENVKICLSSRPWNIFRDAFGHFPQLRLEDLTHRDISKYVEAQLHSHIRFQHILRYDRMNAVDLTSEITNKAAGVFLWVRLVVRELLKGLRDGDGIHELRKRLQEIPGDLNLYFRSMMDSISPHQRQEASAMLQIALYEENEFQSGHPLRLIDLSFIDEGRPDFILAGRYHFANLDLRDREALEFRLDSTIRRLNSRCMGLLECHYQPYYESDEDDSDLEIPPSTGEFSDDGQNTGISRDQSFRSLINPHIYQGFNPSQAYRPTIDFLHRSFRDFLWTPEIQQLLHEYTQGPYDAKMFLINSRISQLVALAIAGADNELALGLASNILSSLARQSYRQTLICETFAATIRPTLEKIIQNTHIEDTIWYIYPSVASWNDEQSSFLTLAIDFDLSSYVSTHLTAEFVHQKRGRPVLDYILRHRFVLSTWMRIGNQRPNLDFLKMVLHFGANPNEIYGSASVWALFLCFLADVFGEIEEAEGKGRFEYSGALGMLLQAGADPLLPKSWLSQESSYEMYGIDFFGGYMGREERFSYRWPAAIPRMGPNPDSGPEPWYAVSDLLGHFRSHLGSDVDRLRQVLDEANLSI